MIITISGKPGSGKSTIAKELSKILGYKRYYIGGMRREIARKLGITLAELNKRDEEEFFSDRIVDERIVEIAKNEDNVIIEGRTAFYFVPYSVKVFLDVDLREGARRIYQHSKEKARPEESYPSVEETYNAVCERMESDKRRYSKYYGFDCYDTSHYDIVIDTTNKPVEAVLKETLEKLERFGIKPKKQG